MVSRSYKEIRQRAPWWLIGLLFGNLLLMSIDARDRATQQRVIRLWAQTIAAPFQRATSEVGGAGTGFFQRIAGMRSASAENEQLRKRLNEIEAELRSSRSTAAENERLRALLELRQNPVFPTVASRVIARDPSLWYDTVTIDKGRTDGVELNMPVVGPGGIVGRVIGTSLISSQVMLVTDERAAAGGVIGQIGESRALGSIRGTGKHGLVEMHFVPGLEEVKVGDTVTTTGQDGIFPAGLAIGQIVIVNRGSATTPHTIFIRPSARLDSLFEVSVIKYSRPARIAPDQTLPNVGKPKN